MITVNGKKLEFDLTSEEDLQRYRAAGERMGQAAAGIAPPPAQISTPADFDGYLVYLEQTCRVLREFIDEVFGEGVCRELIGPKESLAKLLGLFGALEAALQSEGFTLSEEIKQYIPNRRTPGTKNRKSRR